MSECMGEWAGHMSPRAADPNIQTFTSRSFNRSRRRVQKRERDARSWTFRPPTPRSVRLGSIRVEMAHLAHPPTANLPMFSTISSSPVAHRILDDLERVRAGLAARDRLVGRLRQKRSAVSSLQSAPFGRSPRG
jgi:hypothetical protein